MSFIDDLRNLDRNNVGGWPVSVKAFFTVLLFAALVALGWYFQISDQQDELERARHEESSLRQTFSQKQAKAANLDKLRKQLADMQDMLRQMLRQLPSKTEMPELLVDISQTALASGLKVDVFKPKTEVPREFYAEKPIELNMTGTYHQFGTFISSVASLPRVVILTMHNVTLTPVHKNKGALTSSDGILKLTGTVKTYRYLDDDEGKPVSTGRGKRGRGK